MASSIKAQWFSTLQRWYHTFKRDWERKQMKEQKWAKAYSYCYFWLGLLKYFLFTRQFCMSVCYYRDKVPPNVWLKQKRCIVSPFRRLEARNQGGNGVGCCWGLWGKDVPTLPPRLTGRWSSSHSHGTRTIGKSVSKCPLFMRGHRHID